MPTERHMFYLACPTCKKKVMNENDGFSCEKCQKVYSDAVPTYNFTAKISDLSDTISVQCMGEVGQAFMGIPATQFYNEIKDDLEQIKAQANDIMMRESMSLVLRAKADDSSYAS